MTDLQLAEILNRAEAALGKPVVLTREQVANLYPPEGASFQAVMVERPRLLGGPPTDVHALVAALREAKELLREVEWQDAAPFGLQCPACAALKREGHNADCRLAAAIR